ncbi:MAG: zinc-binding dehydrogenase [Chloroflexi bacterium]|nr:zinc-binding dehydrogenase [Chloroflexota bacterium]
MKAVAIFEHGGVDKLQLTELPKPEAGPDDVIIHVKAVALNRLDLWVREGLPGLKLQMPFTLGSDVAGVVDVVGAAVTTVKPGQRVTINPGWWDTTCEFCVRGDHPLCVNFKIFGEHLPGGYAEFLRVPSRNVLPMPDDFDFVETCAAPLAFLTAWRALITRGRLQAGEDVVILGAGSGVSTAAMQIAKYAGARVFATSHSDEKLARARDLGADVLINYAKTEWEKEIFRITNKRGADVVVDAVGDATWLKSLRALRKGGRLVTYGATTGPNPAEEIRLIFWKQLEIIGTTMANQGEFLDVMRLIFARKLKPVVDVVLPLEHAAQAHERLAKNEQFGKIVLTV